MKAVSQLAKKRRSEGLPGILSRCILSGSPNTSRSVPDVVQTGGHEVKPLEARRLPPLARRASNPPAAVAGVGPKGTGEFRDLALGFRGLRWGMAAVMGGSRQAGGT